MPYQFFSQPSFGQRSKCPSTAWFETAAHTGKRMHKGQTGLVLSLDIYFRGERTFNLSLSQSQTASRRRTFNVLLLFFPWEKYEKSFDGSLGFKSICVQLEFRKSF